MAGLRVGYAVGSRERIAELERFRTEMSVGVISSACATASLNDPEYATVQQRLNAESRGILEAGLTAMGLPYWTSETNFVMCDLGRPMMPVNRAMAAQGIAVGRLFPAVPERLRISVGTPEQMARCVEVLGTVLA
jgi:histidinol-phosphate aminotransferase